jgi:CSLREA domain-containing protein
MKKPTRFLNSFLMASLLAGLMMGTQSIPQVRAAPTTYIVNYLADSGDGTCDASCTLRDAIIAANANPGADTITFSVSGTILLGSALPNISDDLIIDGTGNSVFISGGNNNQILVINSGKTVSLNMLTIQDGNSTLSGGGIFNNGVLTVRNSTFTGNQAVAGGGISNLNILTISNSTFSGNSATTSGGAIYNDTGVLTIWNSTFSNNSATVSGGGIYNKTGATLNYTNTIIANSTSGGDCKNDGTVSTNNHNLVMDTSCFAVLTGDPKLDALADNGGPTQTMKLLPGSPALNAGDDAACAAPPVNNLDQRGATRPEGSHCDIGAYEAIAVPAVGLSLTTIRFNAQFIGTTSDTQIVTLTNTGTDDLKIGTLRMNGEFKLRSNTCTGATIVTAGTCKFGVAFSPASTGTKTGVVSIPSNAASSPNRVTLRGTVNAGMQLLRMGNFDTLVQPIPWTVSTPNTKLVTLRDCTVSLSPACSAKFTGAPQNPILSALQVVSHTGAAGDKYYLGMASRANKVPAGGQYSVQVSFYNKTGGTIGSTTLTFTSGTHDFQTLGVYYTVPAKYDRIFFSFTFQKTGGTAWFDDAALIEIP